MMVFLITGLLALSALDWATSRAVIRRGGCEINPVVDALVQRLGFDAAFALKTTFLVVVAVLMHNYPQAVMVMLLITAIGVGWNLYQLDR